jgi:hypothetical protein
VISSAKILGQRIRGKKSELHVFISTFLAPAKYDSSFSLYSFIEPDVISVVFYKKYYPYV